MIKYLKYCWLLISVLVMSGCGFQFANRVVVQKEFQQLYFSSAVPNDFLSREVKQQLRLHGVTFVEQADENIPSLHLYGSNMTRTTASVFQHGREAESLLRFSVNASITIPEKGNYPLNVENSRTFFNDSRAALAKSAEMELIRNDMERYAAKQIVNRLIGLQYQLENGTNQ